MTLYYEHAGVTIYHGDARKIREWLVAAVLVTDPPYGVAYSSGHDHALPGIVGDEDTSARDAVLSLWGDRPALVFGSWKRPRPAGCRALLTWEKGRHVGMGDLSLPWKPNTEEIYVMGRGFRGKRTSSVLSIPAPVSWNRREGQRTHPHEKPVPLLRVLLAKCPDGIIADPFCGSGALLVAALEMGRRAIGVETEERYCEIAAKRLAQGVLPLSRAP